MAFLLGFLIESLLGLIAFWFLEVSSLLFIYMMLNYFLSGHMIPLDLLPGWTHTLVEILPFKYLAYFPCALALGKYTHAQMLQELLREFAWTIALIAANRWVFARGLRRYGALRRLAHRAAGEDFGKRIFRDRNPEAANLLQPSPSPRDEVFSLADGSGVKFSFVEDPFDHHRLKSRINMNCATTGLQRR